MNTISELRNILGEKFVWNKARLDCFARTLLALFAVRTVNLSELAVAFPSAAEIGSRYKRLQRFFRFFKIDYVVIAKGLFRLFFEKESSVYLLIDRTNWYWGKQKINVFMLAVAYEGIAIPLFWQLLPKGGSSCVEEQVSLIKRFINTFGKGCILGILGDREFQSGGLFKWLSKERLPFYIRIKESSRIGIGKKKLVNAQRLFSHLNQTEQSCFAMAVKVFGQKVYLAGSRSERGDLMIVATNKAPGNAIAIYLRRWEIESLFQSLKGRGFRFEDTHLTHPERIEKLMALLAVGFSWAHKVGEWKVIEKPILMKRHRKSYRPQLSYFRYGLDAIRNIILSPFKKIKEFRQILRVYDKKRDLWRVAS